MNDSNQENRKTTEAVFSMAGIYIIRRRKSDEVVFIYHHIEFDLIEDKPLIDEVLEYPTFEEAFQLIQERYRWYRESIDTLHEDYRGYIADKLVERLNEDGVSVAKLRHNQERLENLLGVKLHLRKDEQTNQVRWEVR